MKVRQSWAVAFSGMAAALCVVLMLLGAVIPVAMFLAPALAGLVIGAAELECGRRMALTAYGAAGLLGLLFVPDKEVALIFVVLLGYYPIAKPWFDRRRLPALAKLALCNGAVLAMYGLLALLFPAGEVAQELQNGVLALALATLAIGNAAFLLYDRAVHNLLLVYRLVWQPRLHKMLGWRG